MHMLNSGGFRPISSSASGVNHGSQCSGALGTCSSSGRPFSPWRQLYPGWQRATPVFLAPSSALSVGYLPVPRKCLSTRVSRGSRGNRIRAGNFNGEVEEMDLRVLRFLEDSAIAMRESFREMREEEEVFYNPGLSGGPQWQQNLFRFVSGFIDSASKDLDGIVVIIGKARRRAESGEAVNTDEVLKSIGPSNWPTVESNYRWLLATGNFIGFCASVAFIGWVVSWFGLDAWSRWHPSTTGLGAWLGWTTAPALTSFLLWQGFFYNRVKGLKAFCVAERNKQYEKMGATYVGGASSLVLAIESVGQATNNVFIQQGVVLSVVSGWLAAQPEVSSDSLLQAMGGLAIPQQIPRILQGPFEAGFVGLISGACEFFSDGSLNEPLSGGPSLIDPVQSSEDIPLLKDSEVTQQRALFTFAGYFLSGAYLTMETLLTNSLFAAIATQAVTIFIALQGMQRLTLAQKKRVAE